MISAKCSYAIYSARESQFWDSNKPPLEIITDTTDDKKSDKRASIPPIDNNTKIQIAKRRRIAESKLALTMKAKIAQKRKIAETKLAKTMKSEIDKRREKLKKERRGPSIRLYKDPKKSTSLCCSRKHQIIKQRHEFPSSKNLPNIQTAYQVSALLDILRLLLRIFQL